MSSTGLEWIGAFEVLVDAIGSAFPELPERALAIRPTPDPKLGDFGINIMPISSVMGWNKVETADKVAQAIEKRPLIDRVQKQGNFVNVWLDRTQYAASLCASIRVDDQFGSNRAGVGQKVLLEHTSINPNASPHVGRGRNALIGDTLARLLRYEGFDTEVHYYVNDLGKQIALLVMVWRDRRDISFDDMLALYVSANERAKADPDFEQAAFELLRRFEEHDPVVVEDFLECTTKCLEGQLSVLSRLGITYDYFDRESNFVHDLQLNTVIEKLRERDAVFTDEHNREVVDLMRLGYEREDGRYFVLRRANTSTMYGYRDLAYTLYKLRRCPTGNIVVLGQDHSLYFQQLGLMLGVIGVAPPEIVTYSHILLKEGRMSTREGNVVLLSSLLDEAASRSLERVEASCNELSREEQREIARKIGVGAIKFSILRVAPQSNVIFEWDAALRFEGDSAPYIQYSCTRIASILRKAPANWEEIGEQPFTVGAEEWALVLKLGQLPSVVRTSLARRNPSPLAMYALEVAKSFSAFYHACPVLREDDGGQRNFRLNLCFCTLRVLTSTFGLLGIEIPDRM